ncbi:MAG: hypothetical protein ACRDBG_16205 [Waterburya sp.]
MTAVQALSQFERIYQTDLVYIPDCWQLCGDAHCCSFARYKKKFKIIARTPFQELPLLPGEYEFLNSKGWLQQFGDHDRKIIEFPIEGYSLKIESIVSRKPNCACEHNIRPTICRLYPLLPIFDITGQLIGTEPMGIYEEMERIAGLETACKLTSLPFDQIDKFLAIIVELSKNPIHLYYLEAYRITKQQVSKRLAARCSSSKRDVFTAFESGFIRQNLLDSEWLRTELSELARRFKARYGDRFIS